MNLDGVERHSYFKDRQRDKNKGGRKRIKLAIFLFLLFCLVILIVYFFIFGWRGLGQEKSVKLEINAPEEIFAGHDVLLNLLVVNQENADLIEQELFIRFPENFDYLSSEPACSEKTLAGCFIKFPRLKINEQQEIDLIGRFFGLPGENKKIEARITFQLENFSSWFKKETSKEIILSQPAFDLEFSGADELLAAEEGQSRIKIKNSGDKSASARIILIPPDDFNFINLSLTAQEEKEKQKIWDINLEPSEEKIIDFSGYFSEQVGDKKFILQIGVISLKKEFFPQQEKEKIVKITQPGLVLGLKVNDSFAEEMTQNFGDLVNLNLSYKNTSQEKIFEPVFRLKVNPPSVIALAKNENWNWQQGGENIALTNWQVAEKESGIFAFSSSQINEINPGEEGEIKINFRIKNQEEITGNPPIDIVLISETEARVFHQQTIIFKTTSNQITLKLPQ